MNDLAINHAGHSSFDEMEFALTLHPSADCPVVHRFTPGMYIREVSVPKGTIVATMQHATQHPFIISKGSMQVMSEKEGAVTLTAPHCGITQPGTRRMAYALEDTVWTTFHATLETDIEKIASDILAPYVNPLLGAGNPSNNQWRLSLPADQLTP